MKKLILAVALALTAFMVVAPPASAGQEKSVVCHFNGTDDIVAISIADPAVQSHIDHGDSRPGDPAPTTNPNGATYGANCEIVDNPDVGGIQAFIDLCAAESGVYAVDADGTSCTGIVPVGQLALIRTDLVSICVAPDYDPATIVAELDGIFNGQNTRIYFTCRFPAA